MPGSCSSPSSVQRCPVPPTAPPGAGGAPNTLAQTPQEDDQPMACGQPCHRPDVPDSRSDSPRLFGGARTVAGPDGTWPEPSHLWLPCRKHFRPQPREGGRAVFSFQFFFFGFRLPSRKQLKQTSQFSAFAVILFHLGPRGPVCIEVGLASRWPFWPQPSLGALL